MADDKRPQFFRDVHQLAQAHGIVAYVIVGVIQNEGVIAVGSGAGSRLDETAPAAQRVFSMVEKSFHQALSSLTEPTPTAKSTLVN